MSVKRKLTREERARLREILGRPRKEKYPSTAQQTIPYDRIWPDGICLANNRYTKTLQFQDINYQLAQNEDKTAIFEGWCDFLNYFDSSIHFQLSFVNLAVRTEEFEQSVAIPLRGDADDESRIEYAAMLQNQLAKGNNGLKKTKYITFGIETDSIKTAKPRLERIETDLVNHFKQLGAAVETLNGKERLRLLHSIFHMDTQEKFAFEWDWLPRTGLSTRDFIAPTGFEFREGRRFRMGGTLGAVSFLQILAPELNDRMLADFLNMESSLIVSLHIQSIDQTAAIRQIKRKITELDQSKIDEQKKAIRAGYDIDILPSDLATYGGEAKKLLEDLQSHNERMFLVTFLVMNTAGTRQQLENRVFQAQGIAQKYNCALERLDFQQEKALISSLPLGLNQIEIQRGLTTSSTAIFVPFTTQELFQTEGEPLYYGLNALSNNLIMADRKRLKTPNGLILGTPGSGKSFSAKREITNAYLITDDDVIICDPEGEYYPLVERFHGQVVKISPASSHYINPMDMNLNYSDDDNPLSLKSDFLLSLCELIVGGREGLQPIGENRHRPSGAAGVPAVSGGPPARKHAGAGRPVSGTAGPGGKGSAASRHGAGNLCFRLPQRIQPPYQCGYSEPAGLLRHQGAGQAAEKAGNADCTGSGVGPCDRQPLRGQSHPVLCRRIPPSFEGRTDGSLQRGNLEALPQMGRHSHGNHAERKGFAFFPGSSEYL